MIHKLQCPAKINLYLHITGKDDCGYHRLDSLVAFIPDLFDVITISENQETEDIIKVQGQWAAEITEDNILLKVLELMKPFLAKQKFTITLNKNIPIGAGLGGGSSNASNLLQFLVQFYAPFLSITEQINLASKIGADVSLFFDKSALYAMGIGNVIQKVEKFPTNLHALLIYPNLGLSTKKIYEHGFKEYATRILHEYQFDSSRNLISFLDQTSNMLYPNSLALMPTLSEILLSLKTSKGCLFTRMSGSGSTCFGLFDDHHLLDIAYQNMLKQYKTFTIIKSRVV